MEPLAHVGTCPGMRYATANVAFGDTPFWPRRAGLSLHSHTVYLLEYVKQGGLGFCLEGEPLQSLQAGDYYITPPGLVHGHPADQDVATIHLAIRPEWVRTLAREATGGLDGLPLFPGPVRSASPQVKALLHRLVDEARQAAPWRRLLVDTVATDLVIQLLRDHGAAVAPTGPAETVDGITRAVELILANYDRDLSLDRLAAEAMMSRYHFARRFRERIGMSPGAYLRRIRVEHAAELLRSTSLPITEVALQCGYTGPSRLVEAVQAAYGVAPGALRKGQ